jgi:hypothetical protein
MTWVMLALLLAPQQPSVDKQVDALVVRLGSDDLDEREKAQAELYALGPDIKPRLEGLLPNNSGEAAKRIRAILDRFESDRYFKELIPPPVRITLERKSRTPEEIFAHIKEKTGWNIRASAMNLREPVELGWTDAPALQVVDDVCRALGRGRVNLRRLGGNSYDMDGRSYRDVPEERTIAIDGGKPPAVCIAYSNQFRASLEDVMLFETRDYSGVKANASIILQLTGPPGMTARQTGAWIIDEITDDKGRSLKAEVKPPRFINEAAPDLEPGESRDAVWFTSNDRGYGMHMRADTPILVPEPDAVRIAVLKARIRVTFSGREVSATKKVEELRDGGEIRIGEAVVTIVKAEKQGPQFTVNYRLGGKYQGQPGLEPLDDKGRSLNNYGGGSGGGGGTYHVNWHVRGEDVAQIRIRAVVGHKTIEVPVELKDIPLPKGE